MRRVVRSMDLRTAHAHQTLKPKVRRVVRLVDLRAESADDVHADRTVQSARGSIWSQDAISAEVEGGSEFRLAWMWVEGWRAQLRKAGDLVEKERWEWRVDDILGHRRGCKTAGGGSLDSVSVGSVRIKTTTTTTTVNRNLDSAARNDCDDNDGTRKRVRWKDSG